MGVPAGSRLSLALASGAGALAAYAFYEPFRFRLGVHLLPVEVAGGEIDVLHVSDVHFGRSGGAHSRACSSFLASVPQRLDGGVDLVVATGDLIECNEGIEPLLDAFAGLHARLGRFFVLGSHDYYLTRGPAYMKYLTGERPTGAPPADTERLRSGLKDLGWVDLTNRDTVLQTPLGRVRVAGVDDPYLHRHDTSHIARSADDALAIGLVHAPDVVSEWALAGFDLVVAGHTHAGQVRVPGIGALVTNCSLPAALAGGSHRVGNCWLHVSPGLGTGRFAPIRFLCRPEVTLLRLVAHGG